MAKQLQLRRGTTVQHNTFTGAVGEVTIDTDKDVVVVHDGATAGGFPSQKELVSGTNIKTVNSTTLLGSGNISVQPTLESGTNIKTINNASILGSGNLNVISAGMITGGITNQVLAKNSSTDYDTKWYSVQEPLISGTNIKTVNSTSLLGSGNVAVQATLVSGTNIKTINSTNLLGSGDVPIYTGFKNRIINGDMKIDQRGSVNVGASAGSTYLATDRFTLTNYWGSGQINSTKTTTAPSGFANSLSLTVASAVPFSGATGYACVLWQSIEGFNIADCYNASFTLSFWVRSSVTGTYSITFGNTGSTSIGDGSRIYVANYTISQANTWEQKTITVNLANGVASGIWDSTNNTGLCVAWNLGTESNRKGDNALDSWQTLPISGGYPLQSSSQVNWASNSGATFYITGVQLEKGSTATSFEYRPYGLELSLCQRYYQRIVAFEHPDTQWIRGTISIPVSFRTAPSITIISQTSGSGTLTFLSSDSNGIRYYNDGTAPTVGSDFLLNITASAEL